MYRVLHGTIRKVEETSKHGVGRHQLCSEEKIEVLSNKIERNHPSRHSPVSEPPTGSFTQLEEIDIDFRVSGLPCSAVQKVRHRKNISWPTIRRGHVLQRNSKEFTITSKEIQLVIRHSKNWLDRGEVHRNGEIGTGNPSFLPIL